MKIFSFTPDNLDETLFEHLNKAYGAYELRKSYHARLAKSFLFTLSALVFLFGGYFIVKHVLIKTEVAVIKRDETVFIDNIKKFDIDQNEKTEIIQPPPQRRTMVDNTYEVVDKSSDDNKADTTPVQTKQELTGNASSTGTDTTRIVSTANPTVINETIASAEPLMSVAAVDKSPQFPGGEQALMTFLERNITYSDEARRAQASGKVYASFIINSKGEIESIKIIRKMGYGLDEEVVRVLNKMPRWQPGIFHGKAVSTILNLPVSFSLLQ